MTSDAPRLAGLHHITMITADAQANVDFYAGVLGLRLVKRTVNFDRPGMYHLYFGDQHGSPGSVLTWFESRDAAPGRPGAGMVHRIELGVAGEDAVAFWRQRLDAAGCETCMEDGELHFTDPEGLAFSIAPATLGNPPLRAAHPEVPAEHAILGIEGARAYVADVDADRAIVEETLCMKREEPTGGAAAQYLAAGHGRAIRWRYDAAPDEPGVEGAGSVHHIAWCSRDADHETWRAREQDAGLRVTDVLDRDYFDAIYARVPSGVLFEIATQGPGFAADEDPDRLGEELRIPAMHADRREEIEASLVPFELPAVRA